MRIVVAMSGGVDSSVAAGLLKEQGHEVIGLAMKTHNLEPRQNRACCTPEDMRDARRVADILGIPFYVLNYAALFEEQIVRPFAEAYRDGRTPNPCVDCNSKVKFAPLLERAKLLGADYLATGHYARVEHHDDGSATLHRGADSQKDQSYFLYRLTQEQLRQLLFPLGGMTKSEVRKHAIRLGLPVAEKTESQEICFVGAEGYAATVEKLLPAEEIPAPGEVRHIETGEVLGRHEGIHRYTVGQRRGLGIAHPTPLYVVDVDKESATVWVGEKPRLESSEVLVQDVVWISGAGRAGDSLSVQQRYREAAKPARIEGISSEEITLRLDAATGRGAAGQAAVIYDGDRVLGGGTIRRGPNQLPVL